MHVFADESERRVYLLAAAFVLPGKLVGYRGSMRSLLLPGERRVHFKTEKDARRRLILSRLVDLNVTARIYVTKNRGEAARARLLERLVAESVEIRATRLVLDSRDQISNVRDRGDQEDRGFGQGSRV